MSKLNRKPILNKEQEFAVDCQKSFDYFVKNALQATPSTQQQQFIDAVQSAIDGTGSKFVSVRSGHGTGKSTALIWSSLWFSLTRPEAKVPILAPTQAHILKQLMPEMRKWYKKLFPPFQQSMEILSQGARFANGNEIFSKTANAENPESVAGIHSRNLMFLLDEASGIDDKVFEVLLGALTEENFVFIMLSNPTRVSGTFYDSHHKLRSKYQCLHFNSLHSENVSNADFSDMIIANYGEDSDAYRVRVLGEFPNQNAAGLFTLQLIEESMERWQGADPTGIRSLGVDVAGFGDDKTCIAPRRGMRIEELMLYSNMDTQQVAALVSNVASDQGSNKVFVDAIGIGAGVYDTLKRDRSVRGLVNAHAGKSALDGDTNFNKRMEMYMDLKKWMSDGGAIPPDPMLKEELLAMEYFYTTSGKMQLMKKEFIKDILKRSPDRADAIAFNFYEQVRSQAPMGYKGYHYNG